MRGRAVPLASIVLCALAPLPAAAGELSGYLELTASDFDTTRTDATGEVTESDSDALFQRFELRLDRRIFPNVRLRVGGFFEHGDATLVSELQDSETTTTRLRPQFNLTLRTALHVAELAYNRSEDRFNPDGGASTTDVRETYSTSLAYLPQDLPNIRLDYFRTNAYDEDRTFLDTTEDRIQLDSNYDPIEALRLTYRATLTDTTDRVNATDVRSMTHTARATYAETFRNQRVRFNADYRIDYQRTDVRTSGAGDVRFPLFRLAGFSSIDDDPETGQGDSNPALVDGNTVISAGINIGLPEPGGNDDPRNLGLDLVADEELNALLVWVDRDLPVAIADEFIWDVYVSLDREDWTLHETVLFSSEPDPDVPFATFGPLLRRFEIRFSKVVTRYVKVVVSPLADVLATEYSSILVTELEAQLVLPAEDVDFDDSSTSHLLSLGLRTRIRETPAVYHELTYFLTQGGSGPTNFTLYNGLSLSHRFNEVYSLTSRVGHERDRRNAGNGRAFLYTAALSAVAVPTLRHRLVFSGRSEEGSSRDQRDSQSVFLFTNARLYRGIDLNLGLGKTASSRGTGEDIEGDEINATATLTPHRRMTFNVTYRDRTDDIFRDDGPDERNRFTRSGEAGIAYNPLPTLYLFGSYRVEERSDVPRRRFGSYTVDWSPFPDGTLQLGFRYSETGRSEDDAEETIISPRLRWNISRGSFLELAYQKLKTTAISQRVENEVFSGTLRFTF